MLPKRISDRILTVGADWKSPSGGLAQVMANYAEFVFGREHFDCIVNSTTGSKIQKFTIAFSSLVRFLYKLTINPSPKIIHIHTASYNSFKRSVVFGRIAKLFNKKLVYHIHGGGFKDYYSSDPVKITNALMQADCIIVLSQSWHDFFSSILPQKKIAVINNLIPYPEGTSISETKNISYPINLLFLGKICKEKGIYDLLDVLSHDKTKFEHKIHLHIGGNGETNELIQTIQEKNLGDMVTFHGWVHKNEKIRLFNHCSYYILPSYTEGLPLSIIEAMSYGLPIISTQVGGIPEIITTDNGFLFTAGNKKQLSDILTHILELENYSNMSECAVRQSLKFQPRYVTESLQTVYQQLLS